MSFKDFSLFFVWGMRRVFKIPLIHCERQSPLLFSRLNLGDFRGKKESGGKSGVRFLPRMSKKPESGSKKVTIIQGGGEKARLESFFPSPVRETAKRKIRTFFHFFPGRRIEGKSRLEEEIFESDIPASKKWEMREKRVKNAAV